MSVSFANLLYLHCFDMFARTITAGPWTGQRAIFNSGPLTITNDEGVIIAEISDQETIMDLLMTEFTAGLPKQGDIVGFAADTDIAGGSYEITDGPSFNSGGQATYYIRKLEPTAP
jgi:hypothetical protein